MTNTRPNTSTTEDRWPGPSTTPVNDGEREHEMTMLKEELAAHEALGGETGNG